VRGVGFTSPGRARALLIELRHVGFVEETTPARGTQPALYRATRPFLDAWFVHLGAALEAARLVEPALGAFLARTDDPAVADSFIYRHGEGLLASSRVSNFDIPYFRVFLHRHGGGQLVSTLLTTSPGRRVPAARAGAAVGRGGRDLGGEHARLHRLPLCRPDRAAADGGSRDGPGASGGLCGAVGQAELNAHRLRRLKAR
jgi:hypothetical protein